MEPIQEQKAWTFFDLNEITLRPVIYVLLGLTSLLIFWSDFAVDVGLRSRILFFVLLVNGVSISALFLESWQRVITRWVFILGLAGLAVLGANWLEAPSFYSLLFIPVCLAGIYLGFRASLLIAAVSALLVVWDALWIGAAGGVEVISALLAAGFSVGMLFAISRTVRQSEVWVEDYYHQGLAYWQDARQNQEKLFQTLDDLTRANEQMRRLNLLAQNLRQQAEEARRTKDEFVANVSHELRTPLNMIIGFSELIVNNPQAYGVKLPAPLMADLTVIYRNASHLSGLINDILDLSQIELGQMALSREWVNLAEIVADSVLVMRPMFYGKGLYLETDLPPDLPPVYCDRLRIREVLLNLLSNAGRFTDQGGVTLSVVNDEHGVIFKISDTGPGIKGKDLGKLFQPFQQLDSSIRRRFGGTGLGLNISKNFVDMHGGKVWVESAEGEGTTFSVFLPDIQRLDEESASRWISPDWEYHRRIDSIPGLKTSVRPHFIVIEKGSTLQRLLSRYHDTGDYIHTATITAALEEFNHDPARAFFINAESVPDALDIYARPGLLPPGIPAIICSIPEKYDEINALVGVETLTKPISREKLITALERLSVNDGTILVVDDQTDALQFYGRILSSTGKKFSIVQATDGEEALGVMADICPDLIILDLIMPGMDGFQFLEHLHRTGRAREFKILVISAFEQTFQPILIKSVGLTRGGGLSLAQFLEGVKALDRAFSLPD